LSVDAILHESTIYGRREKLIRMADGLELGDVYGGTIERIKAQAGDKSRLGMAALMWISHAERPLEADELCHALAVKLGFTYFNNKNVPLISTLVSSCQGLVTVDKEATTVRFIHFTLQEYLATHPDVFSRPHSVIAEICLAYLNSRQDRALSAASTLGARGAQFLSYCSVYWEVHAKRELSNYAISLAVELLKEDYGEVSTELLLGWVPNLDIWGFYPRSPFNGLHCASFFGIVEVVVTLIEIECYDINGGDFMGYTPLARATRNGYEVVVKLLVGREEVNSDVPGTAGRTPLLHAADGGHVGVAEMLLGWGEVNPNVTDNYDRTPFSYAAQAGREGVVRRLLKREEVNPGVADSYGRTPLPHAAGGGSGWWWNYYSNGERQTPT